MSDYMSEETAKQMAELYRQSGRVDTDWRRIKRQYDNANANANKRLNKDEKKMLTLRQSKGVQE